MLLSCFSTVFGHFVFSAFYQLFIMMVQFRFKKSEYSRPVFHCYRVKYESVLTFTTPLCFTVRLLVKDFNQQQKHIRVFCVDDDRIFIWEKTAFGKDTTVLFLINKHLITDRQTDRSMGIFAQTVVPRTQNPDKQQKMDG